MREVGAMTDRRFGELLREARGSRSRARVTRRIHYTETHLRGMESGARKPPRPEQVLAICEALDINPTMMVRAAIAERGSFELDVTPARPEVVEFCGDLAVAWSGLQDETLWKMRQILGSKS